MTLALLFPGQGVQHADMLPWLASEPLAEPVLTDLATRLGADWRARLADEAWASSNRVAQPLMAGISLAAWRVLAPHLPPPTVVAGYSVGELAAYGAAGVFDAAAALDLAEQRARFMDAAATDEPGGLLAVSGLRVADVEALCAGFGLAVALHLAADRCILGGPLAALDAATPALLALGAEPKPLRVHVASHTAAMASASQAFAACIEPMAWPRSATLVVNNLDGAGRRDAASLKHALAAQISHTVQWARCLDSVAERQPRCVLEVGPGTSLSRLWAARWPEVPVRSVDEFHSAGAVGEWVERVMDER
jgi:[acyl-carrier-protein] S-malonyltransferase